MHAIVDHVGHWARYVVRLLSMKNMSVCNDFGYYDIRGNLNRYTKRPLQDSAIIFPLSGWGNLRFTGANHRVPANVINPQGGKSTDFSAGKCHLLYFVVGLESLRYLFFWGISPCVMCPPCGYDLKGLLKRFGTLFRDPQKNEKSWKVPEQRETHPFWTPPYYLLHSSSGGSPSEAHNPPRGSLRKFASQRSLWGCLRGLCGVSPRVLRGLCGVSAGVRGISKVFRGVVTLCL